jgi:hypothetical protein
MTQKSTRFTCGYAAMQPMVKDTQQKRQGLYIKMDLFSRFHAASVETHYRSSRVPRAATNKTFLNFALKSVGISST